MIRSDNATNFQSTNKEMQQQVESVMNNPKLKDYMAREEIELKWKFNTPATSHHGGAWERQIRSVPRALSAVIQNHSNDSF